MCSRNFACVLSFVVVFTILLEIHRITRLLMLSMLPTKVAILAIRRTNSRAAAHYPSALLRPSSLSTSSLRGVFRRIVTATNKMVSSPYSSDGEVEKLSVGILLFPNVEVLDFAGPFEVFSRTRTEAGPASRRTEDTAPFHVFTVSQDGPDDPVLATGNLQVTADYSFEAAPKIDILLVPGGIGTRPLLDHEPTLD